MPMGQKNMFFGFILMSFIVEWPTEQWSKSSNLRTTDGTFTFIHDLEKLYKESLQEDWQEKNFKTTGNMLRITVLQQGVWALLLGPWCLTASMPLDCTDENSLARCPSISQEKVLDRVIHHAELIYRVSEESCSLFEEMFIPFPLRLQSNQAGYPCITRALPIPSSRSEIQQISDKWLLHSVLMLVQSWVEPLVYLQTTLDRYDNTPDLLLNKTKWVSEKLISLEQGVVVLIKKMLDEGSLATTYNEQGLFQYDAQPEMLESVIKDYTILSCFTKDAHKMETFLKLLKCRQTDKYNCA